MEIHIFRCHRGDRSIRSPWTGTSLVMAFPDDRELSLDTEAASAGLDSVPLIQCGSLAERRLLGDRGSPAVLLILCTIVFYGYLT